MANVLKRMVTPNSRRNERREMMKKIVRGRKRLNQVSKPMLPTKIVTIIQKI